MMNRRPGKPVRFAVLGVSIIYSVVLHLAGLKLDTEFKQVVAVLPAAAGLVLMAWDVWLWRLPLVHRLTKRPRLQGLWAVELHPTAESQIPEGGNRGPISAYLVITQTYWSIAVRQYTNESKSDSRTSFWQRNLDAEVETLSFLYENNPEQRHQSRSPRHLGTCSLDPTRRVPSEMTGVYFTDRYTKGDMTMKLVDRSTGHPSFKAAQEYQPKEKWWKSAARMLFRRVAALLHRNDKGSDNGGARDGTSDSPLNSR